LKARYANSFTFFTLVDFLGVGSGSVGGGEGKVMGFQSREVRLGGGNVRGSRFSDSVAKVDNFFTGVCVACAV
jgi:hypothetical protein